MRGDENQLLRKKGKGKTDEQQIQRDQSEKRPQLSFALESPAKGGGSSQFCCRVEEGMYPYNLSFERALDLVDESGHGERLKGRKRKGGTDGFKLTPPFFLKRPPSKEKLSSRELAQLLLSTYSHSVFLEGT